MSRSAFFSMKALGTCHWTARLAKKPAGDQPENPVFPAFFGDTPLALGGYRDVFAECLTGDP